MTELDWKRLDDHPLVRISSTGSFLDAEAADSDGGR